MENENRIAAPKSSVRLYALLARAAPVAVIFRRGPSRQVQIILWKTDTDSFHPGQWFKGRIYERRCDLSPSGRRLIYFAAKYREPLYSWTAVSHPPFLTAVALWPKGDGWGGGGLFVKESKILLNHRPNEMSLADGFKLPKHVSVSPFGARPGWGEDDPIWSYRLTRDGWTLAQSAKGVEQDFYGLKGPPTRLLFEYDPPQVWEKASSAHGARWRLQMIVQGIHERDGPWYVTEYALANRHTGSVLSLGRTDWADWHAGDVVFGKEGCIYRLAVPGGSELPSLPDARLLIDLRNAKFKGLECPEEHKRW